ncbi:Eco57I restriction-modification methylase domain-containing protein [Sphaerospermopsis kisseleviana CS-549]|uniref:site-specific DNA-methyltransferase (adenine-specific) n=1 Tax=Sphaerospermopsis kisseleviana CS-549 TaxID=3021783 RepID=A0ABT4ZVG7_9CYAN|nr:DNA methyltransferase [Sphaerospermopsis kisseleviana]MDB9443395.1 Eco57I restriction-modification methylase domain-containing protein [Sphaerospermopsis kisseleviana CS-549]BAZ81606.1 putative transcriptional regulator [Sphaerospermopsis kisseleviana NIES-73]
MKFNRNQVKKYLQLSDFTSLFIEELGWDYADISPIYLAVDEENSTLEYTLEYTLEAVAQKRGLMVYHCVAENGILPNAKTRKNIDTQVTSYSQEHLIIYTDKNQSKQVWQWVKRESATKTKAKETTFNVTQSGELLTQKLEALFIDFAEEENLTLTDVTQRTQTAFDIEKVTKDFFNKFQERHLQFVTFIKGIENTKDANWYASVILNRLMFIYFLQKKGFLDDGNTNYLQDKLKVSQSQGQDLYYQEFLQTLFFDGFGKAEKFRKHETPALIGKIKYINGGLFLPHQIEEKYNVTSTSLSNRIQISDTAFEEIFKLFSGYTWHLDDTPSGKDDEINPDVLGYIFEKYINQKEFGAYYTKPEITNYLCERTINKFISGKIGNVQVLENLNNQLCQQLLDDVLPNLSILDPACGSGAFLVAALQHLIKIYTAIFDFIQVSGNEENQARLTKIKQDHPSLDYYIKKRVITDNLYGVDIMEEAVEIAKLRLFLSLVAAAKTVDDLEPLPNVDFNIMSGNSLIGLIRVDGSRFDNVGQSKQGNILQQLNSQNYQAILKEKNASIRKYKEHAFMIADVEGTEQEDRLEFLRENINRVNRESLVKLNQLLLDEFSNLKIKYEEVQLKGKPVKRLLNIADMEGLKPFHWGYHFDQIIARGGFDIILGNPPWEIFKPQAKEFFAEYSDIVTKNKMDIKTFEKQQKQLLENPEIATAWLKYQSQYLHVSLYYRSAEQYKNQISVVNGKKQGTDINLYKLFVEQCVNLLSQNGECGLVIPSGIYTDLGTKQLREMLFSQTNITGLFCFENRKAIFEGVDSRFKFVVLTFENGKQTLSFPAKFMRHDVGELNSFPGDDCINMSVDLIKRLSPDSISIMEFKTDLDIFIAEKMSRFPLLGEEIQDTWNLKLTAEFHMTNDSHLFKTEPGKGRLPLYEGKMIHQFNHKFAEPRYWVDEVEGRKAVLGKNGIDKGQVLDYQCYRFAYRAIARNTDSRTFIGSILPKNIYCGHSLNVTLPYQNNKYLLIISSMLNSFCFDFVLRQQVSANLTMFFIYQTPVPRLTEKDEYFHEIVERAAKLICTTAEYDELAKEVGLGSHKNGITEERERGKIRAELDGIIAHLYGLTESEFSHILSTFPIVAEEVKNAALNAYREMVK